MVLYDRAGSFSFWRLAALVLSLLPAATMAASYLQGEYEPTPTVPFIYYSGIWATALLLATLSVTPLRAITGLNRMIGARRILGLATCGYGLVHLLAYAAIRLFSAEIVLGEFGTRATVWLGLLALLGLMVLAATSSDAMVRHLGAYRWKQLHASVYAIAGLTILHFLMSPGSVLGLPFMFAGFYLWLMGWRLLQRRKMARYPCALIALSVLSGCLTALLEAFVPWLAAGYDPMQAILLNFSLDFGLAPSWTVVLTGLGAALLSLCSSVLRRRSA